MKAIVLALAIVASPLATVAQSQAVDPPSSGDMLKWLEAPPDAKIYNYGCNRLNDRTFVCEFDMPPGAGVPHVRVKAAWVGSDWSFSFMDQ